MFLIKLATVLFLAAYMLATPELPAGTALPVFLSTSIDAKKDKPGKKIEGVLKQDVQLSSETKIRGGSRVVGHILEISRTEGGGFRVVLSFDQLHAAGHLMAVSTSVRAVAAKEEVFNAGLPINAASDSLSADEWTTRQVGGDVVNRGRGLVASADAIVGRWDGGVRAQLTPAPDAGCPASDSNGQVQAMWVFSTSACGVYGLSDVKLGHAGRTTPLGHIELDSSRDLKIGGGSGWLLLVNPSESKP